MRPDGLCRVEPTHLSNDMSEASTPPSLSGVRCLVLGAGGFLGGNLCHALLDRGALVSGFGRSPPPQALRHPDIAYAVGDMAHPDTLLEAVKGQEIVFHLASSSLPESSNRDPAADLAAGLAANLRLLQICRASGTRKVIFASSGGTVYGMTKSVPIPEDAPTNPISAYGITKLATEKYLRLFHYLHGLDFHALRISNPYGPGQSPFRRQGLVAILLERLLTGKPIEIWGDGEVVRDFVHVNDVVEAFLTAAVYDGPTRS